MNRIKDAPPLNKINTAAEGVQIRLDEPLLLRARTRKKKIGLEVLTALARLEVLLSKEDILASSETKVQNLKQQQYNKTEIDGALETFFSQFKDDGMEKKDVKTYLTDLGLTSLFPKAANRLVVRNQSSDKIDVLAHFHDMNVYNQLIQISLQIRQDIRLSNHKYMAHQLALLYQCINQVGGNFIKYKSGIEQHFDEIKTLTNTLEEPTLSLDQKQWLADLTADVVTEVLSGKPVTPNSKPLATYLNNIGDVSPKDAKDEK